MPCLRQFYKDQIEYHKESEKEDMKNAAATDIFFGKIHRYAVD